MHSVAYNLGYQLVSCSGKQYLGIYKDTTVYVSAAQAVILQATDVAAVAVGIINCLYTTSSS